MALNSMGNHTWSSWLVVYHLLGNCGLVMLKTYLIAKLHDFVVTECNLNYEGSVSIDKYALQACGIEPGEQVHIWNITNGHRIITYAIEGEHGQICINGAGAHLFTVRDRVIIASFAQMTPNNWAASKGARVLVRCKPDTHTSDLNITNSNWDAKWVK